MRVNSVRAFELKKWFTLEVPEPLCRPLRQECAKTLQTKFVTTTLCLTINVRYDLMIQDDIISELKYIPEAKLFELYDLIHYFRLGLTSETEKNTNDEDLKIDTALCLTTLEKIKKDYFSRFT